MSVRDRVARLDRLQRTFWFKVIASAVIVVVGLSAIGTYIVHKAAQEKAWFDSGAAPEAAPPSGEAGSGVTVEGEGAKPGEPVSAERAAAMEAAKSSAKATAEALNQMLRASVDPTAVALAVTTVMVMCLVVVWLGLGLTGLGLAVVAFGPLVLFLVIGLVQAYRAGAGWDLWLAWGTVPEWPKFVAAVGALALSFFILMEVLKLAFGGASAVLAVASNVVHEAVRMKVSLVFIVLLLLGLGALPGLLDENTPLRYRVQSFLQYGTGGAYWIIAVLVLFLATASVAFEQRDRVIWQTMTKPVASWQYLLGKWLGVSGVAAVLLAVSSTGVFLFTEYLREQKAKGEVVPFVTDDGSFIAEDRFVLESQVLTARESVRPVLPQLTYEGAQAEIDERIAKEMQVDPAFAHTEEARRKVFAQFQEERRTALLTIEAGQREKYEFRGLKDAKAHGRPLTLRFRADVGGNDPRNTIRLTFQMDNMRPVVREVPLGQSLTLGISPGSVTDEGVLTITVINGDTERGEPNPDSMSFPPDGLEVYYAVGSYRPNFLRVVVVLWLKLVFLAIVGIAAATFLSFPVACMVAFGIFLAAETSGFLFASLDYYASTDEKGNLVLWRFLIRGVAVPVAVGFKFYSDLKPTSSLVDGRMVGWIAVVKAGAMLGALSSLLFAVGVGIFRKRELATYSGQ